MTRRWIWILRTFVVVVAAATTAALAQTLVHLVPSEPGALLTITQGEHTVDLLEPRALWLLLLLPAILLLQLASLTDFPLPQRLVNVLLRAAVVCAIVGALARPSVERVDQRVCVAAVVDVSRSMNDGALAEARDRLQPFFDARGRERMHLVTVASEARRALVPASGLLPAMQRHEGEEETSNLARGLRLAGSLCPGDHVRRVLVFSDGNENRGDAIAEAARLRDEGVRVDVLTPTSAVDAEVLIRRLVMPDVVQLSEPFMLVAEVWSNTSTEVTFDVTQNEFRDVRGRRVAVVPGVNRIEFPVEVYEQGERTFRVTMRVAGDDRFEGNNHAAAAIVVEGRPRVLYVEGESRSRQYLQRALDRERNREANFDVEVRGPAGFPSTIEELRPWDAVIVSDVSSRWISRSAMSALQRWVREDGGGLILLGGEDSLGPGGFDNTPLEDMSPVTFDLERQRDMPSLAMALVIDRSGSMDGINMEMAKEAARAVVDMLGPQDSIGVVAFDTVAQVVVRMQSATNRSRIRSEIGRIGVGGGTDILPGLSEAYVMLLDTSARRKHVIVLTDGQAPWDGIASLASAMRSSGITVSSVAVGREADRSLLEMIADLGGGRFHATNDPSNVPQIFVQETSQVARTNLIEEPFRAVPVRRSGATRGIPWESTPYFLGYVRTRAKRGAEVLLETERGDPLLARWRLGLGRVVVFTSDAKNRWSVEWVRSRWYPQFWAQLVRDSMRVRTDATLALRAEFREGGLDLSMDAIDGEDRWWNGLRSVVVARSETGTVRETELRATAPGRYEARWEAFEPGIWSVEARHFDGETQVATSRTTVTRSWPDELMSLGHDTERLGRIARAGGGRMDPGVASVWSTTGVQRTWREEFWPWMLFAALGLLVVDLLLRRIRLGRGRRVPWGEVAPR